MRRMPKTGEPRKVKQPLKIDAFPEKVRAEIQRRKAEGETWQEIEDASEDFAGKRLPHTSLQRWWDLRVAQVRKEVEARSAAAREIAAGFAGKGVERLPDAVRNALSDQVFALMQVSDEKSRDKVRRGLLELGLLLADFRRLDIQQQRADAETKRIGLLEEKLRGIAGKVGDLKAAVAKRKVSPQELQRKFDEIYG